MVASTGKITQRFDDETVWLGNELIATIWYGCQIGATAPRVIVRIYDTRSCMLDSGRIWDGTDESERVKAIEAKFEQADDDEDDDEDDDDEPKPKKTPRKRAAVKGGAK